MEVINQEQLYQTAIHEAGHAVVSLLSQKGFHHISIIPNDAEDDLGHIQYLEDREKIMKLAKGVSDQVLTSEETDVIIGNEITMLFGGYVSELKLGIDNLEGAAYDIECIRELGIDYAGDDNADHFIDKCLDETKRLVDKHWVLIQTVANQLLDRKTLTSEEVIHIIENCES